MATGTVGSESAAREPIYTVRIINAIRLEAARKIREDLREKGYDAFVTRSGNAFAVNIGRYAQRTHPDAIATRDRFVKMKYNGQRCFSTAYTLLIKNRRSIVK